MHVKEMFVLIIAGIFPIIKKKAPNGFPAWWQKSFGLSYNC
jgi:hypothetical protein